MKTQTLLTVLYPVSAEDIQRIGVEVTKDEAGQLNFVFKFLTTKVTDPDAIRAYRELFKQLFDKPSKALIHVEDVLDEHNSNEKAERTVKIEDRFIPGENFV